MTATPALAQEAAAPQESVVAKEEGDGEIVVSGTRIASSGFTAPTPTTVIGEDLIESRGATNAIEAINEIPAFRPSQTPAAAGRGGTSSGGSFVDLRGLSAVAGAPTARTLVLVDGRRFVPSNQIGQVDLNLIPAALISRVEVVTGGASAAWGSDAVAGVVNILLKEDLEGVEGGAGYGVSDLGDFKEYSANLAMGASVLDGRIRGIFGVDYVNNEGVPDGYISRDWGRKGYNNLVLTASRAAGLASRNVLPDVRISDRMAPGGVIVGGVLDNIEFTGGQGTRVFTPGTLVSGNQMLGGGANNSNAGIFFAGGSNLVNPVERFSMMGRLSFDVTDTLTAFVEVSHGETIFTGLSASHRDDANLTIRRDNAFLPESVRTLMVANNLQTITVGRIALDDNFGYYQLRTDQKVDRVAAGIKGEIAGWKWNGYYQHGRSNYIQRNQAVETANYLAAIDAVRDGSGNIVCRTGAANNPDPGCVPFNIFGQNSPSQAAVDYVRRTMVNNVTTKQTVAAFNITGEPLSLWAGPLAVAFGVEYRKEEVSSTVDADSLARRYDVSNFQPLSGSYDTKEIYAEVALPLLRESAIGHALDINGAVRRTDYSTSGVVTTWKVGGSYEPVADLRLRATLSRDIRAPNLNELFARAVTARAAINDPVTGASVQANSVVSGNLGLKPESADTFTGGAVFQPTFVPGFRASVDYYHIKIKDVIAQLTAQVIVDRCNAGVSNLCSLITRTAGTNVITEVRGQSLNFNALETMGVDFELQYALPAETVIPGQLTFRALGTYVDKLVLTDSGGPVDRVRQTVPHWTWNASLNYAVGRFSTLAQLRYIGDTVVDATLIGPDDPSYSPTLSNSINVNRRPPVAYLNLSARYELMREGERSFEMFGVVNNVFDKDPPPFAAYNPVGGVLYDVIGRSYRVGFRFKY
jgi:outer membrane receptor protein involved in Fe transport